jgi:capsular exopolysaccharide synthesis family protein
MAEIQRSLGRSVLATRRSDELEIAGPSGEEPYRPTTNFLTVVWRRRWVVIGCTVAALIAGAVYLMKAPPVFASQAVIYVQQPVPKVIGDELATPGTGVDYLNTQCQIITSAAILTGALQVPGVADTVCLRGIDNSVGFLKSQVVAQPAKQTELIDVSMEASNPQDAATIVNAVVESYLDYQGQQHKSTAVEVLKILQKEVDQREQELQTAQKAIEDFRKANPEMAMRTDKGNIVLNHLSDLLDRLTQAQLRQISLTSAVEESRALSNDPDALRHLVDRLQINVGAGPDSDQTLMAEFAFERRHLADLMDQLGPQNDMVVATQHHLSRLQAEIQQTTQFMAQHYQDLLEQESKQVSREVADLQNALDKMRNSVVDLNEKEAEYDRLVQDEQRATQEIDILGSRMKEVNFTEDVGNLSVIESAKPNSMPVRPKHAQTMAMALIAGLMIGLGGALLRDMVDQRLRSVEEISGVLDLPVLGAIPHMLVKATGPERGQEIHLHPRSDVAESYRTVRTAIHFGVSSGPAIKTILVTSPAPGDGKTTLASNLAIAIAQASRRVLVIDADCRRPMMHKIFQLSDQVGVSSVLMGTSSLAKAIQKTNIEMLDVLPCGPLPHNPAEMLNSQAFLDVVKEASQHYDQILLDSPPIVPVTDARILGASADVTILVLRAEKTTRRMAEFAREAMFSVGASVLGCVVNDVPRGKDGYGYYYYAYGYGRTYGSAHVEKPKSGNGNGNGHAAVKHIAPPAPAKNEMEA